MTCIPSTSPVQTPAQGEPCFPLTEMEIKNHQVAGSGLTARKSRLCTTAQNWKLTGRGAVSVAGGSADKAGGGGLRLSPAAGF